MVVKADAPSVIHKTESGGVALNLNTPETVCDAVEAMKNNIRDERLKFTVQKYIPATRKLIIGAIEEKGLGHIIMFGLGGVFVEVLKDTAFELTPVTASEAKDMVRSIKSYPLIGGFRGEKGVEEGKITETILRVSQLVTDLPMIRELD